MAKTLVIKTKLKTDEFARQYKQLTNELDIAKQKQEAITNQTKQFNEKLKDASTEFDYLSSKVETMAKRMEELNAKSTKGMSSSEYQELEQLNVEYEKTTNELLKQSTLMQQLNSKLEGQSVKEEQASLAVQKVSDKMESLKAKQDSLNAKGFTGMSKQLDGFGKKVDSTIKRMGRWLLAVFSIRTAYALLSSSVSTVTQYNQDLAAKIESIKFTLAMSLEPVITRIVNWVYTLIQYVNYLSKAWFGVDLFANASAKATQSAADSAADMKKSLAGFDTANVLSDSSSSSASSGSSTSSGMTNLPEGEVPEWLTWIAEHGSTILTILEGIGIAIAALKIADFLKTLGLFGDLSIWQLAGGIGLIITGIGLAIKGVIDFIKEPTWQNFLTILEGIALVVAGIAVLCGAWVVALVALGVAIVAYIIQNWDKVKEILGKVWDWVKEHIIEPVKKGFKQFVDNIKEDLDRMWEQTKGVASMVANWFNDNVIKPVVSFFKGFLETIWSVIKLWFSGIQAFFTTAINLILAPIETAIEMVKGVFSNLFSAVKNIVSGIGKLFTGDLKGALNSFKSAFSNVFGALWSIAKAPLNLIIRGINALIKGLNKIKFDVPSWVPSIGGKSLGFNIKTIPTLATGGIVNNPGRGVPVGAIAGEAGREGVLPLTDSQAMAQLGQEIGKWISVNVDLTTKLDSRVLSRSLEQVQKNKSFVRNGG